MPLGWVSRADEEVEVEAEVGGESVENLGSVQGLYLAAPTPMYRLLKNTTTSTASTASMASMASTNFTTSSSCSVGGLCEERLSLAAVIASLTKSAVGVGSLFMPACFHRLGLLGGFLAILAAMCVNLVSLLFLSRACRRTKTVDYLQLASILGGPTLEWITSICLLFTFLAPVVVNIKLTQAYLNSMLSLFLPLPLSFSPAAIANGYGGIAITALLLWPMTLVRDGKLLARFSAIGMLGMLYVAVLCFGDFASMPAWRFPDISLFNTASTAQQVVGSVATILFSFSCHFTAPQLLQDLQNPTLRRRGFALGLSSLLAAAFYTVIGASGYLVFGPSVADDILTARPHSLPYTFGKVVLVAVNIVSFPLIAMPVKVYLQWICEKTTQSRGKTLSKRLYGYLPDGESSGDRNSRGSRPFSLDLFQGALVVAVGVLLSTFFHSTGRVFDFVGSIFGAPIILIFPAVFFSRSQISRQEGMVWRERVAVNCLIVLGAFFALSGLGFCIVYG